MLIVVKYYIILTKLSDEFQLGIVIVGLDTINVIFYK
jgi:hypothetical protein